MDTRPDRYCCIGIDLGTSGCRGISIDHRGRILAQAETSLPPSTSPYPAWREQQPEDWWQATVQVIRQLLAATRHCQTAAIAVDGTSSTLLLTDPAGQPLTAALMYNDQRAAAQCATLAGVAPSGAAVHSPSSSLAKLLWLLEQEAATHSRALHQSELISGRLCGRFDLGDENNCLKLGYDPVNCCWPSWMEKLGLPDGILPNVIPPSAIMGSTNPVSAALTGLPDTCQVIAGTTDSTAAALAAGLERPGDALTSLGSTLVCKLLSDAPLFDAGYGIYSHRIFGKWLTGGASNTGGTVLRQHFSEEELESLSRRIDPARSLCLDYYPLRFPVNDPDKPADTCSQGPRPLPAGFAGRHHPDRKIRLPAPPGTRCRLSETGIQQWRRRPQCHLDGHAAAPATLPRTARQAPASSLRRCSDCASGPASDKNRAMN